MGKRSPGASAVRAAMSLSATRPADPLSCCNVCGQPSDSLSLWYEHDEWDQMYTTGNLSDYFVYIGKDHPACIKKMEAHPRLYGEGRGDPGAFPRLCGPCVHRRGLACAHPDLRKNGGAGLLVNLYDPLRGAIVCSSRGRVTVVNHALKCAGREERK